MPTIRTATIRPRRPWSARLPTRPRIRRTDKYRTLDLFNLSGLTLLAGSHTLDLVAYDVANNKSRERIAFYVEIARMYKEPIVFARKRSFFFRPSPLLILLAPARCNVEQRPGDDRYPFVLEGDAAIAVLRLIYSTFAVTGQRKLVKALSPAGTPPLLRMFPCFNWTSERYFTILGFNVYRSPDGSTYTQIGTENYGSLISTNSLVLPLSITITTLLLSWGRRIT